MPRVSPQKVRPESALCAKCGLDFPLGKRGPVPDRCVVCRQGGKTVGRSQYRSFLLDAASSKIGQLEAMLGLAQEENDALTGRVCELEAELRGGADPDYPDAYGDAQRRLAELRAEQNLAELGNARPRGEV